MCSGECDEIALMENGSEVVQVMKPEKGGQVMRLWARRLEKRRASVSQRPEVGVLVGHRLQK